MNVKRGIGLSVLAIVLVVGSGWALPAELNQAVLSSAVTASKSAVGTVALATVDSFTLEVKKGEEKEKLVFVTDANTKFDGKLEVGALATVEYRTEGARNIATYVKVEPQG